MHIKSLLVAGLASAVASAAPTDRQTFSLTVSASKDSPINGKHIAAAKSGLFLDVDQHADCSKKDDNVAVFYIEDEILYLYGDAQPREQFWLDPSNRGKGSMRYIKGIDTLTKGQIQKGWAPGVYYTQYLTFGGHEFIACPATNGEGWGIWNTAGTTSPNGSKDCTLFSAQINNVTDPNSCIYTLQ